MADSWDEVPDGEYEIMALGRKRKIIVHREVQVSMDMGVTHPTRVRPPDLIAQILEKIDVTPKVAPPSDEKFPLDAKCWCNHAWGFHDTMEPHQCLYGRCMCEEFKKQEAAEEKVTNERKVEE